MSLGFSVITAMLLSLVLAGCLGGYACYPVECEADYPLNDYIYRKDSWGPLENFVDMNPSGNPLTKEDFLTEWGNPDEVVSISADKETWAYHRREFCGIVPIYIVPVPLGLPLCRVSDQITFENERAVHIHFRRIDDVGAFIMLLGPAGDASWQKACPGDNGFPPKASERLPSIPGTISIPHSERCNDVAFIDGTLWWTDGSVVTEIDPRTREVLDKSPVAGLNPALPFSPSGFGSVWLADGGKKSPLLSRVDPAAGKVVATIPLVREAGRIAAGAGAVWVLHDQLLTRVDPQANQVVTTIPLDYASASQGKIAANSHAVWIALGSTVIRIDPLRNQVAGSFQVVLDAELPNNHYGVVDLAATEETLWILAFKGSRKFFGGHYFRIGLAAFDARSDTLHSAKFLGSGDSREVIKSSLAVTGDAVWACLPLGLYVIPIAAAK